jgi:hypothetical protein
MPRAAFRRATWPERQFQSKDRHRFLTSAFLKTCPMLVDPLIVHRLRPGQDWNVVENLSPPIEPVHFSSEPRHDGS